jgi:hypothetical protein
MIIYIVYEDNGFGGSQVDRVFDNITSARNYVMTEYMVNRAKNENELHKMCDENIEEHTVLTMLDEA